ncbi:hypothetical protein F5Y18DRAFT_440585 [Xylariaceae sp. FL1019]|nr:hypothetical protein F5Y18DRAFT_440585 [Xylariaceae sp. FL1019]
MDKPQVYFGVWTNYSKGRFLGATLTTTQQRGALLIAFTAFLIPFVASRFWKLLCIFLHRYYSTKEPRNAIHHQRQVILRNSSSPDSGLATFLQMMWTWHRFGARKDVVTSILPITVYAIICILTFSSAGGLSSQISISAGKEVLLKGDACGIPWIDSISQVSSLADNQLTVTDAANYAQQCYRPNGSSSLSCDTFVTKFLPTMLFQYNASCPFEADICRGNNTAIHFDTGFIDSNKHLGLNLPSDQTFAYRRVAKCAPLVTDGHTTSSHTGDISSVLSVTYQGEAISSPGYFVPSSSISHQDGDVSLAFLSGNGVIFYKQPMDDEWYRATEPSTNVSNAALSNDTEITYRVTEAASPLACVQQYQWCNTAHAKVNCGPLASWDDAAYGAASVFNLTKEDLETDRPSSGTATGTSLIWPLLVMSNPIFDLNAVVSTLGAESLASQSVLETGIQFPLPKDQWQIDVTKWWNVSLASIQSAFMKTALGTAPTKELPLNDQERKLCRSQKILSSEHSSFNLFALIFTYSVSGLIITMSFIAEPILAYLSRHRKSEEYEYLEWTANDSLQLHRLTQEQGPEEWYGGSDNIPTTSVNNMLAHLDISDPTHPILSHPTKEGQGPDVMMSSYSESNVASSVTEIQPDHAHIQSGDNEPVDELISSFGGTDILSSVAIIPPDHDSRDHHRTGHTGTF